MTHEPGYPNSSNLDPEKIKQFNDEVQTALKDVPGEVETSWSVEFGEDTDCRLTRVRQATFDGKTLKYLPEGSIQLRVHTPDNILYVELDPQTKTGTFTHESVSEQREVEAAGGVPDGRQLRAAETILRVMGFPGLGETDANSIEYLIDEFTRAEPAQDVTPITDEVFLDYMAKAETYLDKAEAIFIQETHTVKTSGHSVMIQRSFPTKEAGQGQPRINVEYTVALPAESHFDLLQGVMAINSPQGDYMYEIELYDTAIQDEDGSKKDFNKKAFRTAEGMREAGQLNLSPAGLQKVQNIIKSPDQPTFQY